MPSGRARRAIGVVSKAPSPGNVKSRLAADLGDEAAAHLYAAFLRDALVAAASLPGASVTLFHPPGDDAALAEIAPPGVELAPETGCGYGEILPAALRRMLSQGPAAALLGADSPALPEGVLRRAFEALEVRECDIAIGPASDGGYYLLAVNGDYPELFAEVEWSTERVFQQILARANARGLQVEILPEWYDVDDVAGLERLARDLAANGALGADASRAALDSLRQAGHQIPAGEPPWRVEERQVLYASPWRTLVNDRLETHVGERIEYAYLRTEQAVWVVPVTTDERILLVRQYRHPIGRYIVEVPAGGGEGDPAEIARRELAEETGGRAGRLIHVASFYPASAHVTHRGHVFVALDIEFGSAELESTELLSAFSVPFELALDMAQRGEIGDSQSALAILVAEPVIRAALAGRRIEPE